MKIQSFPPLANCKSEVLLLGTMPGIQSLAMAQYYGHPRNLFWKLIATIFDEPFPTDYKQKKEMLVRNNIAVWDVLQACERQGSLDSAIVEEVSNDFSVFFREHPNITLIAFNGNKSAAFFKKHVGFDKKYIYTTLPSTSPANAGISFEQKLADWKLIKNFVNAT